MAPGILWFIGSVTEAAPAWISSRNGPYIISYMFRGWRRESWITFRRKRDEIRAGVIVSRHPAPGAGSPR
jgi:hypothetical protein